MPKAAQQDVQCGGVCGFLGPSERFVEAVVGVLRKRDVAKFVQQASSGVDEVTVAHAVVLLSRACLLPQEVTALNVVAGVWLVLKYNDHPSCADELPEYFCRLREAESEQERASVTSELSAAATQLWRRMAMRCVVTPQELTAVLACTAPHTAPLALRPRKETHPALWTAMREWTGVATHSKRVHLP